MKDWNKKINGKMVRKYNVIGEWKFKRKMVERSHVIGE